MNGVRFIFIALFVVCIQLAYAQSSEIDSIKKILPLSKGHEHFELLIELFKKNLGVNYDSALHYASLATIKARQIGDSLSIVKSYNAQGWTRMRLGSSLCIPDFEYALEIARRNGYQDQVKYLLNNLAISHNDFANYDKALEYHFQSLQLRQLEGKASDISVALNNIGLVYSNLLDYENALAYFQQSKDLKEKNGINYDLDRAYINIALTQFNLGDYDLALENISKVLEICNEGCNDEVQVEAYFALAKISMKKNLLSKARDELKKTIEIARRIGSNMYQSQALHLNAVIELEENSPNKALIYLNESQSTLVGTNLRDQTLSNYLLYVSIYNDLGNYQSASEYQQKYIQLNREIFSGDLIKNISRIQTEHEERENIKTIAAKDQVLALQDEIIARQKQQYAFIITITFLTLGLAFVMYRANQSQRKINQELAKAKETIQTQNEMLSNANLQLESEVEERTRELVESNESLVKVNDEMDNFIYKTSHDIRGPLASLKGICNVAMMDVKDEAALDYLNKLDTSAAKLNAILSRLLIINQINHSILTPEKINFEEQIEEILELEKKKELPARFDISYSVVPYLVFSSDMEMAKIILENLIDNAIKYHNNSMRVDPFVKIEIGKEGKWVCAKVIDNGIGIDEESKEKIFQLFVRASERSDSGGIGLYLSKLATIKLGGDIHVSTSEEGYTVFKVLFPPDLVPVIEKRKEEEVRREKQKQKVLKVT
ncbi:MAG: tetratricopeptide repeat-containing sensor histidine kinase [Cyclobacteriaceae bacterium]